MAQHVLKTRIRPFRVAVLLDKNACQDDLMLSLKFLSSLWGGRYGQLLSVEPCDDDPLTCYRLSQARPDLVYGIGIDQEIWSKRVHEACQARGFGPLDSNYVDRLHESIEQHITAGHVIRHLNRTSSTTGRREQTLRITGCDLDSPLLPFVAAMFGLHYDNIGSTITKEDGWISETSSLADLITIHTDIISKSQKTWLDLASQGLSTSTNLSFSPTLPTIVLVDSPVSDFALFWNLRHGTQLAPPWLIPLPLAALSDSAVPHKLKEWFLSLEKRSICNSCLITSMSVPLSKLEQFASKLQDEIKETMIDRFYASEPTNRLPYILPYSSEQQLAVESTRQNLTFLPPKPKILEGLTRGSWIVELNRDIRKGRAFNELCLPARTSTFAVLNSPGPISIPMSVIPRLADGIDGINVHCMNENDVVRVYLPTANEVLSEILFEVGITPVLDEKHACYQPVIKMFFGIESSAQAFSGQRITILESLLAKPLSLDEIRGRAKLGKGKLEELAEPELPGGLLKYMDPVTKRIFQGRRRQEWTKQSPSSQSVDSLLEFWVDCGIVSRQWHLGPCTSCMGSFWEPNLDISKSVYCPGCGQRMRLPSKVPIGYSLHRLVRHAINEGIVPVVLTGRFLKNLTHRGFQWIPGVKYKWNEKSGDIDILACCDGHIVVGECKSLNDTPIDSNLWGKIFEQFSDTIKVGHACRASFVVLAVLADEYPQGFQEKVDKLTGSTMRSLLLTKKDLEQGDRTNISVEGKLIEHVSLEDLIVDTMPDMLKPQIQ